MDKALPPLEANATYLGDPDDEEEIGLYIPNDDDGIFAMLSPDFATVGSMGTEPESIDKALRGPNADKWQAALDYQISQLEKLGTWVIEDLPKGEPVIPCTEVLKEKRGDTHPISLYTKT